jgi:ABC-type transporter Mla subunit MlaD
MATASTRKDQGNQGSQQALDQAKNEANTAADKAREALGHVGSALSSTASAAGTALSNTASTVGQKADDAAAGVGTGLKSVAGTIRQQGPHEGMLGQATSSVAGAIESTGQYLSEKQLSGMADDVASMIKAHPIPAVLIGLGVGFLLGRALRD